jgi:hypothetical protein
MGRPGQRNDSGKGNMKSNRRRIFFLFTLIGLFFLSACGYTLYGAKDSKVESLSIGKIENTSYEPRLQELLVLELSNELSRQGMSLEKGAPYQIHGTIKTFELRGIAESGEEVFTEYEVRIVGSFFLKTPDGKEIILKGENPFIVTFPSRADLSVVFAAREEAVKTVLKGLSAEIVAGIVYGRAK